MTAATALNIKILAAQFAVNLSVLCADTTRMDDSFLSGKLAAQQAVDAFRQLRLPAGNTDLCSNDYLGIVHHQLVEQRLVEKLRTGEGAGQFASGSTGSRLLAGNYALIETVEQQLARFHEAESGLIFNSGYDANCGLLSTVPQRGDTIIFDQLSHASIRDGIRLSLAGSFSFRHNDLSHLEEKVRLAPGRVFVVTESVFSMDGDLAPLEQIALLCSKYNALLIVDEAHATGVIGDRGEGLVQSVGLADRCFARIHTFGKAVGAAGAIVLGSQLLHDYLVNFCRSFIYTTALPAMNMQAIAAAYELFPGMQTERRHLQQLIELFRNAPVAYKKMNSHTAIQAVIIPGNGVVKQAAQRLQESGLDVRPILSPTVAKGSERLRIVLHAFNSEAEVMKLVDLLQ